MKNLLSLLLCFLISWSVNDLQAQVDEVLKKEVLIIPFDRFEFHTEYKLSFINKVNGLEGDQYFEMLSQAFSDAFVLGDFQEVRYQLISDEDYNKVKSSIVFSLSHGSGHYGTDLSSLHENMLQKLLQDYNCDYLMIVSWYRIFETQESVKLKGAKRYGVYSEHMLDYDFFNRKKELLSYGANRRFMVEPTEANLKYSGLRISDLRLVYHELALDISKEVTKE